ncbi:hypothetical protein [uncultured Gammaproteobacteria bacterium]|nr:hypothetical protein [uncultured Gammaproteobacteria bacterium]
MVEIIMPVGVCVFFLISIFGLGRIQIYNFYKINLYYYFINTC